MRTRVQRVQLELADFFASKPLTIILKSSATVNTCLQGAISLHLFIRCKPDPVYLRFGTRIQILEFSSITLSPGKKIKFPKMAPGTCQRS